MVHQTYVAASSTEEPHDDMASQPSDRELVFSTRLSDEGILEKARSAENGEKFSALWNGDTGGYQSHSEADMAMCCLLAYWTGGDPGHVDALFRQSGLVRPKWDEVHYSDGATYGERTVERVCVRTSDYYSET